MDLRKDALTVLEETSRTFFIPISRLPDDLRDAVASAYLCMRAIDEIEDHPELDLVTKARLLRRVSLDLQAMPDSVTLQEWHAEPGTQDLPEVSLRLGEWARLAPESIAGRIWDTTAAMADRMAYWAECNWQIKTEADLDRYTFSVAGAVGLMLSDLWEWHDGTRSNRTQAIGFGRGLQTVNILRNAKEDKVRGVTFFPSNWGMEEMFDYARKNLKLADDYTAALPPGPALDFCTLPLVLANGTLHALTCGEEKLSRTEVLKLVQEALSSRVS